MQHNHVANCYVGRNKETKDCAALQSRLNVCFRQEGQDTLDCATCHISKQSQLLDFCVTVVHARLICNAVKKKTKQKTFLYSEDIFLDV